MIFKNTRIIILVTLLILGSLVIAVNGLKFGLDFNGGTEFVLTLDEPVDSPDVMSRVVSTISQRLDWSGLKDVRVSSSGDQFIVARVATFDNSEIADIEEILQTQGRFESIMQGQILFTGDDILNVSRTAQEGYSISQSSGAYSYTLPFTLRSSSAKSFSEKIHKKCELIGSMQYECEKTFLFVDRPLKSLIIIPQQLYVEEEFLPADPNILTDRLIGIEDILFNAQTDYLIYKSDLDLSSELSKYSNLGIEKIIVPKGFDISLLEDYNFKVTELEKLDNPWIWDATGLKSIVWLNPGITNNDVESVNSSNFRIQYNLIITGSANSHSDAVDKLENTYILLSSGSLPVGIESLSKETVDPTLGKSFIFSIVLMGLISLLLVTLVLYIRYRSPRLIIPMLVSSISEAFLTLSFASLISWNLDLLSFAGIVAAVGTGIDDQIIMTDEMSKNKEDNHETSLVAKIKNSFFIIFAAATTTFATMFPIILFGFGLGKLVGFAITTLAGVLIGILITRPAYSEMLKYIMSK